MKEITFFDTTLRDGEQTPGVSLNVSDKIRIAQQVCKLGVDIIEAGFPAASRSDFRSTQKIAKECGNICVAALCRAVKEDIDTAWEAISCAEKPMLHVFIATSELHMKFKLKKTRTEVLSMIRESVAYARSLCDNVRFSAEDGARSDLDFLIQAYNTAIDAGAETICIVDTVGFMLPEEFGALVKTVIERTHRSGDIVYAAHCHNDLGLACANTLEAVRNGVTQVDCTVNGIGERAGNASLEELAVTMTLKKDELGVSHAIKLTEITHASRLVSSVTGISVPTIKPIVGKIPFHMNQVYISTESL